MRAHKSDIYDTITVRKSSDHHTTHNVVEMSEIYGSAYDIYELLSIETHIATERWHGQFDRRMISKRARERDDISKQQVEYQ